MTSTTERALNMALDTLTVMKAERDRYRAVLAEIATGLETAGYMQHMASTVLSGQDYTDNGTVLPMVDHQ